MRRLITLQLLVMGLICLSLVHDGEATKAAPTEKAAFEGLLVEHPFTQAIAERPLPNDRLDYWAGEAAKLHDARMLLPGATLPFSEAQRDEVWQLVKQNPHYLARVGKLLPRRTDVYEWVYHQTQPNLPDWLVANSPYGRELLIERAREGHWTYLMALVEIDWTKAEPIARGFLRQPSYRELGLEALFRHQPEDTEVTVGLTNLLNDTSQDASTRCAALEALLSMPWSGRDSLFQRQLKVQFWANQEDNPLRILARQDPERWVPALTRLLGSPVGAVHNNAADCLLGLSDNPDALRPLLPWLSDPTWAKTDDFGRLRLIQDLEDTRVPEAVPGLLAALGAGPATADKLYAARALKTYAPPGLAKVTRKALEGVTDLYAVDLASIALELGGFSIEEQVLALESLANELEGKSELERMEVELPLVEIENQRAVALALARRTNLDPAVVDALLERIHQMRQDNVAVADSLEELLYRKRSPSIDRYLWSRVVEGNVSTGLLVEVLRRRDSLSRCCVQELGTTVKTRSFQAGVAAVLLRDPSVVRSLLDEGNPESTFGLLAAARLIGLRLPPAEVERLGADEVIRPAAIAYLTSLESADASESVHRVSQRYSITGRSVGWDRLDRYESDLRERYEKSGCKGEVFAQLAVLGGYYFIYRRTEVWLDNGAATLVWSDDLERHHERQLTPDELFELVEFYRTQDVDNWEHGDFFKGHHPTVHQFVHLRPNGGRRTFCVLPTGAARITLTALELKRPEANFIQLGQLYSRLNAIKAQTHYPFLEGRPGARVIEKSPDQQAVSIFGDQQGPLVELRDREGRTSWHRLEPDGVADEVSCPEVLKDLPSSEDDHLNKCGWMAQLGNGLCVYATWEKLAFYRNKNPVKLIARGRFADPLVEPKGRWALVAQAQSTHWADPNGLARVNLRDLTFHPVSIEPAQDLRPLAYLFTHDAFLVQRTVDEDGPTSYFLVDPATGQYREVEGECRPWASAGRRPLQPTEGANYWAAISSERGTQVGILDEKTFTFEPRDFLPGLQFDSSSFWVDGDSIYLTYLGDLLLIPLVR